MTGRTAVRARLHGGHGRRRGPGVGAFGLGPAGTGKTYLAVACAVDAFERALIADALACVGEPLERWLDLRPLDPAYRAFYPDGSTLDVHADPAAMAAEVERVCGPAEAAGYLRFVEFVGTLYRLQMRRFIDRNLDSPLGLVGPSLARLVALGGFRRLAPVVARYLKDPRTQRVFSFQAMYAGLAPHQALAIYAVIAYMDTVAGVYFPRGGMRAVPEALAAAATEAGVELVYLEDLRERISGPRKLAAALRAVYASCSRADRGTRTAAAPTPPALRRAG